MAAAEAALHQSHDTPLASPRPENRRQRLTTGRGRGRNRPSDPPRPTVAELPPRASSPPRAPPRESGDSDATVVEHRVDDDTDADADADADAARLDPEPSEDGTTVPSF